MVSRNEARAKLKSVLLRGATRVDAVDRVMKRRADQQARIARLAQFYDTVRAQLTDLPGAPTDPSDLPTLARIEQVELAAQKNVPVAAYLRRLTTDADFDGAAVTLVRDLIAQRNTPRARSFAQVLQTRAGLEQVADLCLALCAIRDPMPYTAWELLGRQDIAYVLKYVGPEYFRLGFAVDRDATVAVLDRVVARKLVVRAGADGWLDIARTSFAVGAETQSAWALDVAQRHARGMRSEAARMPVQRGIDDLRTWYGRRAAASAPIEVPAGEIPFAVIDYKQPDRRVASVNLGDPVQTVASLGHLVRRSGLRFAGEPDLVEVAEAFRARVKPEHVITGDDATVRLYTVERDATEYSPVPDGTWLLAFGWYMHPVFGLRYGMPFNPRLRPILVSFHMDATKLLTSDAIDYLRAHSPIGCRDWNTTFLLQAAGVPAFFSGCLTTTIDTLFPPDPQAHPAGTVFVDTPATGPGDSWKQGDQAVARRTIAENMLAAVERVSAYRDRYSEVVTSRLHCYLPTRSIGGSVDFRPKNSSDARFDGLAGISDEAFDTMRGKIREKLAAVFEAIVAGRSEDEVYAVWREVCAADVAAAEARRRAVDVIEPTSFDIAAACTLVRESSVTVERSQPAPQGDEINIEFSLDGNLKHQMGIVLESIVTHSSRPIRLFVLCRDHGPSDFEKFATLFPTVSFVWLPTDHVDYGRIIGMIKHITVATMDRLLLPDLLPEVDRIIHHDIDALCLADIAELWSIDLQGHPLAARDSPHPNGGSGFRPLINASKRLRTNQALARELILRTHSRHEFDFEQMNAGIMVLDLAVMRADEFCRHYLPYAERFGMNDQEILNAYAGANRASLDRAWNAFPRLEVLHEPKIIHWLGGAKPWRPSYVAGRELWRAADARYTKRVKALK